ncbi:hypothetical protein ACTPC6_05805 [Clostridioides difficile]
MLVIVRIYITFATPLKKLLRDNNLRYIKVHELRHTNATFMLLSNTNIKTISERLRDTYIRITMNRYSSLILIVEFIYKIFEIATMQENL